MAVILSLHFLLATGFMLYFFHASASTAAALVNPATEAAPSAAPAAVPGTPAALLQDKAVIDNIIEATKKNPAGDSANSAENVEQEPQAKEQPAQAITTKKVKKETESGKEEEEQLNAVDAEPLPEADRLVAKDPEEETDVQPGPQGAPSQGKLATEPEASTDQIENDQEDKSSVINESTPGQQETSQNEEKSLQNEDKSTQEEEKSSQEEDKLAVNAEKPSQKEEKPAVNAETESSKAADEETVVKNV